LATLPAISARSNQPKPASINRTPSGNISPNPNPAAQVSSATSTCLTYYLGDLARHLGDAESARTYFQESLAIAARLAQADPNRADLQRDLAVVYDNLGDLARDLNQIEPAQGYLQISLAILERLATTEPKPRRPPARPRGCLQESRQGRQ
jgi:tetratricopeptide (TPR) repeat protein